MKFSLPGPCNGNPWTHPTLLGQTGVRQTVSADLRVLRHPDNDYDDDMMMIIMLVITIMCLPRSVCPTTRSASSGQAAPLVTAWRPSSPASSSGYWVHLVLKYIQDLFLSQEVHLQIVAEVGLPSRLPSPLRSLWTAGPSHLQLPPPPARSSRRGLLHRQLQHGQQLVSRLHARP